MVKYPILDNAVLLSIDHPATFEAPTLEDINKLKVGDTVKVCCNPERFWVEITSTGEEFTGSINNDLIFTKLHGLKEGDIIAFKKHNIYSIYTGW